MFLVETCFPMCFNGILLLILHLSLANCSFYDEEQETDTEANLNITYCESSGKNCVKPYDGKGIFGSHSPIKSARGWLFTLAENNVNGCRKFNIRVDKVPWIALVERGVCNFENKIKNAFKDNATAVIIYDDTTSDSLVKMSHEGAEQIVAVSIKRTLGVKLASVLVNRTKAVFVEISIGDTRTKWQVNPTSVLFVSVSFIVLMVISLAWLVFYYVQRFRYVHARDKSEKRLTSAAKKAIAKLSTRTVNKKSEEDEVESCAVCLDGYYATDVIRILPCQHEFHKQCIDPWLIEHRTCPMCKLNILKELGVPSEKIHTQAVEVGTAELQVQDDHQNAVDNQGVVMGELDPVTSERRPSSDTSDSSSVSSSGPVLHVSAEVNWERNDQCNSTSNLINDSALRT